MVEQKRSTAEQHRIRIDDLNAMHIKWEDDSTWVLTDEARATAEEILNHMERIYDQRVMDAYFVIPAGDGGLVIESFDPTHKLSKNNEDDDNTDVPMSAFDTDIEEDGSISFWYCENFYYEKGKYHAGYEIETDERETSIDEWIQHAERYQQHMQSKLDDTPTA